MFHVKHGFLSSQNLSGQRKQKRNLQIIKMQNLRYNRKFWMLKNLIVPRETQMIQLKNNANLLL